MVVRAFAIAFRSTWHGHFLALLGVTYDKEEADNAITGPLQITSLLNLSAAALYATRARSSMSRSHCKHAVFMSNSLSPVHMHTTFDKGTTCIANPAYHGMLWPPTHDDKAHRTAQPGNISYLLRTHGLQCPGTHSCVTLRLKGSRPATIRTATCKLTT